MTNDAPLLPEVVRCGTWDLVGPGQLGAGVPSRNHQANTTVHVSGHFSSFFGGGTSNTHPDHGEDETHQGVWQPFARRKQQRPAAAVVAGDICAIGKLSRAETGDTLG